MFSFGSDPEFCLINNEKKLISAIGLIPGNKKNKQEINGNYFYNDNVLAECNMKPGYSKEETIANLREIIQTYHQIIAGNKLFCIATIEYPEDQLLPPEAKEIGCDPETCCYDLCDHHPDRDLFKTTNVRTSGGHIHVGHQMLTTPSSINRYRFIRMMDLFVGIPSVFLDQDPTSKDRRAIYGEPGRFRKQKHGAEYRSLSNFWLVHPEIAETIYDLTAIAVNVVEQEIDNQYWTIDFKSLGDHKNWLVPGFKPSSCHHPHYDLDLLKSAIKEQNKEKALPFLELIKPHLTNELFELILNPKEYSSDLEENWK